MSDDEYWEYLASMWRDESHRWKHLAYFQAFIITALAGVVLSYVLWWSP